MSLIEYNPTSGPRRGQPAGRRELFVAALARSGIVSSVRSRGADVAAACGQLALTTGAPVF